MSERPIGLAPGASLSAAGQDERKYTSANPVVRALLRRWTGLVRASAGPTVPRVLDVGVGEGYALRELDRVDDLVVGIDYRLDKLQVAVEHGDVLGVRSDAGMLPFADATFDLVICTEVLEHLLRTDGAVRELARVARGPCVVSVPWEPWFRLGNVARGKNLRALGNDPEHVQHYSRRSLESALRARFTSCSVATSLPWLVAVAANPSAGHSGGMSARPRR